MEDLWWCNGLVPALATSGSRHRRVLHLHQPPLGLHRAAVGRSSARRGAHVRALRARWPRRSPDRPCSRTGRRRSTGACRCRHLTAWSASASSGASPPSRAWTCSRRAVQRLDRMHPDPIRLVVAGDARFVSPADASLVSEELSMVADVERLGWVSREQFFDAVDVLVVPSVWDEPFGLVAVEAMGAGRPVVVSDAGALPEVVGGQHPWVARGATPSTPPRSCAGSCCSIPRSGRRCVTPPGRAGGRVRPRAGSTPSRGGAGRSAPPLRARGRRTVDRRVSELDASLVVPSYRGASHLPVLFEALRRQDFDGRWEAVIVLDGVEDESPEIIEKYDDLPLRMVAFEENRGRSAALNVGFAAARGRVLIRCDDDLEPIPPTWGITSPRMPGPTRSVRSGSTGTSSHRRPTRGGTASVTTRCSATTPTRHRPRGGGAIGRGTAR